MAIALHGKAEWKSLPKKQFNEARHTGIEGMPSLAKYGDGASFYVRALQGQERRTNKPSVRSLWVQVYRRITAAFVWMMVVLRLEC